MKTVDWNTNSHMSCHYCAFRQKTMPAPFLTFYVRSDSLDQTNDLYQNETWSRRRDERYKSSHYVNTNNNPSASRNKSTFAGKSRWRERRWDMRSWRAQIINHWLVNKWWRQLAESGFLFYFIFIPWGKGGFILHLDLGMSQILVCTLCKHLLTHLG